ncbi:MAG: chemotaxis protein CheB [Ectothiorhodospira sp.]
MNASETSFDHAGEEGAGGEDPSGAASIPPIIGIGASAGGLAALRGFLEGVPEHSGYAFVIVQHLDPTREGVLASLLQKSTPMGVNEVTDGMRVEPDQVYVIPPGKDLSLLKGVLHLLDPSTRRGLRLPIDFFFRALAADRGEASVGVVLSGTGCDGTLGLRAIREHAGLTLVQDPEEAESSGMPRSVIDAGLADHVLPVGDMGERIVSDLSCRNHIGKPQAAREDMDRRRALEKIVLLLRAHTGHDFANYKFNTLYRRVERRMGLHQLDRVSAYVQFLRDNPQELDLLFNELLIGVTSFFRDPLAWEALQKQVLTPLIQAAPPQGRVLRAWVVGCSTGEEAYSLAMAFREVLEQCAPQGRVTLQIFATDLNADAIEQARKGLYPTNIAADVSPERLQHFFLEEAGGYRVCPAVREMVIFAVQNVIMDPPFTRLDLLICRNLLIYLNAGLQHKLLPLFHYSLLPGGTLFLGNAESVGGSRELFTPLDARAHLFLRSEGGTHLEDLDVQSRVMGEEMDLPPDAPSGAASDNIQSLAERILLERFSPPAVLVNGEGDILYIFGQTGAYLEPAAGRANWNIHVMAREGLRQELAVMLPWAVREAASSTSHEVKVGHPGQGQVMADVTVYPLNEERHSLKGMLMIVFQPLPSRYHALADASESVSRREDGRVPKLEEALKQAQHELRMTREYMQTSQEELRSANEELQSTNEELTTSKEEMQSLNEELQTVNTELESKVEELTQANSDLKNLLDSTDIATVFLSRDLRIRRFTQPARKIFKLIPGDVGRPLSDIVTDLDDADLQAEARQVLHSLESRTREIPTRDGRWYQVRIMPYRTLDDVIDGVVLTLMDITQAKRMESRLRGTQVSPENTGKEAGDAPEREG